MKKKLSSHRNTKKDLAKRENIIMMQIINQKEKRLMLIIRYLGGEEVIMGNWELKSCKSHNGSRKELKS